MSIIRCDCCDKDFDLDYEDGSYSEDGGFLCENCSIENIDKENK